MRAAAPIRASSAGLRSNSSTVAPSSSADATRRAAPASIMVRVMKLLDSTGIFPGAAEGAFDQTGTRLLEQMLDERT